MGKSMMGPDEIDVMALMQAIQVVHHGLVEVVVRPAGLGFSPSVAVVCRATFDVVPGSRLPDIVEVSNPYPCPDHMSLYAHVYDGLYRLDAAIQRAYEQMEMPMA